MIRTSIALSLLVLVALAGSPLAHADGAIYELKKGPDVKVAAGTKAKTTLTIASKEGWHVNDEAPLTVTLTPDRGVTVEKAQLTRADLADKSMTAPRFDIAFTAAEAGKKTINAEARFVMCHETSCKPVKETLAFNIEATAAAATAPAPTKKK